MAVKTFTTGEVLTSADTNTYLANSGLVYVKQVTVPSGATSVDITSCFSSTYDNYVISLSGISTSTNNSMNLFLLQTTTPTSSGWYGTEFYCATGNSAWSGQVSASNAGAAYCSAGSSAAGYSSIVNIQSPNLAQYTRLQYQSVDSVFLRNGYAYHGANTQYDGCRLAPTSGTISGGTITVYGYRKG
jgi:hypothetical protein